MNNEPRHLFRERVTLLRPQATADEAGAISRSLATVYINVPVGLWPEPVASTIESPEDGVPTVTRKWRVYLSTNYQVQIGDVVLHESRKLAVVGAADLAGMRVVQKLTCQEVL
jgi:hypothetical protein